MFLPVCYQTKEFIIFLLLGSDYSYFVHEPSEIHLVCDDAITTYYLRITHYLRIISYVYMYHTYAQLQTESLHLGVHFKLFLHTHVFRRLISLTFKLLLDFIKDLSLAGREWSRSKEDSCVRLIIFDVDSLKSCLAIFYVRH